MPDSASSQSAISRQVPLEQLVLPEADVRDGRDPDGVRSIAASMGDPDVGQQQPISVYPNEFDTLEATVTDDDLVELFETDHPLVIHDGVTRYRAAQELGWSTLWTVITPEPPENEVVARLEANTERLDMSDYEIYSSLYEHYQDSGMTLEDVGETIGVTASYVSRVFSLLDSPDWLYNPWRHDDHPLETSHALSVMSFLSEDTRETYATAGGLDDQDAYERAVDDAQLMIDVQGRHDLQVGEFRDRCRRCKKETVDELKDQRTHDEKTADGQATAADSRADHYEANDHQTADCRICGQDSDRRIALDVCASDYGMLSDMKARDDVLMAKASMDAETPQESQPPAVDTSEPAQELLQVVGQLPTEQQQALLEDVQAAVQTDGGQTND